MLARTFAGDILRKTDLVLDHWEKITDPEDLRAFQSCFDARDKLALEKADPTKAVCPDHHTEMITSYQLDLEKVIWAYPKSDCKNRYINDVGFVTTDDFPSRSK